MIEVSFQTYMRPLRAYALQLIRQGSHYYSRSGLPQGPLQRTMSTPLKMVLKLVFVNVLKMGPQAGFIQKWVTMGQVPLLTHLSTNFRTLTKPF